MTIINKINYLIEEKNLSKKEFVTILQSLEPKLNSTGNIPNEQTIYGYLNGKRELKVELIPYIAEVLEIKEQELFEFDIEYSNEYNYTKSKDAREILDLLQYLPNNAIKDLKSRLYQYKSNYDEGFGF